jgi:ABC-2 type transport system ATP-binding protein
MSMPAIECIAISKEFEKKAVLRDISLRVDHGSVLALVGSNGAGKTTLLKILATLVTPSSGKASVCGVDVQGNPFGVKARVGFVSSEERSFYWRLTGRANLQFFAALYGLSGKDRDRRIDRLLDLVNLGESAHVRFREYSTGMKQSLAIARGMLHDSPVLILDEPTRSLSPDVADRVCGLLRAQAVEGRKAVLVASHNLGEVERIADAIAIMHRGAIRATGSLAELHLQAGLTNGRDVGAVFSHFTRDEFPS